jgi:hypothetical protein
MPLDLELRFIPGQHRRTTKHNPFKTYVIVALRVYNVLEAIMDRIDATSVLITPPIYFLLTGFNATLLRHVGSLDHVWLMHLHH